MLPVSLPILLACLNLSVLAVFEQRVIIDFGKNYSGRAQPIESDDFYGRFSGLGGVAKAKPIASTYIARSEALPSSLDELKDLIRQMDRVFSGRIESLAQRVSRLEAHGNSQVHRHQSVHAEWIALSVDKRIRLFQDARETWLDAKQICEENSGSLLLIETEEENKRITGK